MRIDKNKLREAQGLEPDPNYQPGNAGCTMADSRANTQLLNALYAFKTAAFRLGEQWDREQRDGGTLVSRFITDLWLHEVGFKPHTFANQPGQHWLLWLNEDLGLELAFGREKPEPWWFCYLRTRGDHSYENFINLRDLTSKHEVITLVQSLTGRRWNPARQ